VRRGAPLIAALIALVVAGLAFFLLVWPKMGQVRDTQEELDAAQAEQLVLETELARLRALQERAPELRERLAQLRREVPPVADLPGLITRLQRAADRSGVDFFSISPGTPLASAAGAAIIPAEIQVVGEFFSVDEFLFRLEDMNRAAKVTTIAVTTAAATDGAADGETTGSATGGTALTVALSVEFFTTDINAGPGAPVEQVPEETPQPGATPSPSPSPSPTPSPTEGA